MAPRSVPLNYRIPEMDSELRVQEVVQRTARMPGAQQVTGHRATRRLSLQLDETSTTRGMLEDLLATLGYSLQPWNDARSPLEPGLPARQAGRKGTRSWVVVLSWGVAGVLGLTAANLLEGWLQPGLDRSAVAPWLHALGGSGLTERHLPDLLLLAAVLGTLWILQHLQSVPAALRRFPARRPKNRR